MHDVRMYTKQIQNNAASTTLPKTQIARNTLEFFGHRNRYENYSLPVVID